MTVFTFRNEGVVVTCGVFPKKGGGFFVTLLTNRAGVLTEAPDRNDMLDTLDRLCLEVSHMSYLAGLRFRHWIKEL